jgi:hypothetical protein
MREKRNNANLAKIDPALLSREVRDIISYKPKWLVRHGILLFFIIFLALVSLSFFIKYPEIVSAKGKLYADTSNVLKIKTGYYAKIYIWQSDFSKIKKGQKVLIDLPSYPANEFGTLTGTIDSIYLTVIDNYFPAKVKLMGLITNYDQKVEYIPNLMIHAKILIKDTKLSDRIFNNYCR